MRYDVRGCRRCGGCGVITVADAFAWHVDAVWIERYRCEQYLLCDKCAGIGVVVVHGRANEAPDVDKIAPVMLTAPLENRLTEIFTHLPAVQAARILNGVRKRQTESVAA